ncbi:molybdopterin/thiamine biosynthesis adenylyltransferase [Fontibacillus phaseoli]|uniref:Molybdopterin/thiamine biosynthesis adenylyltransferase n=1 Tax=Fontibacillus phaseoli TaxID=1416533 RepID=A0A369BPJ0_9BACL|nr:thiazole biosynthesis adenylyltransferase ThiF [Fontibacillus phaseoli]RCX23539.1 molybdopterin/thiamine biosynthesis adenylyltransferase [Fontibacillus phaseoli]
MSANEDRYSRQVLFTPIGSAGQQKLAESSVLIIGAGALGTGIAETLARAGVGRLVLADRDYVEWSNLQRQQLYTEADALQRLPKAVAAGERLRAVNSTIKIESHVMDVTIEEIEALAKEADLIMDATDNFDTRLLINDISQKYGIPWIYGGCVGSYGMTYTILPGETPCLNCLLGTIPLGGDTCDTVGVIPPAVQIVVAHQVTEALKLLTGHFEALRGTLLTFDLWRNEQTSMKVGAAKREDCLSCGNHRTYPFLSAANHRKSEVLCGRNTVQIRPAVKRKLQLPEIAEKLERLSEGKVECNPFLLSFSLREQRLVLFEDGRALIHGTKDITEAKAMYDRYLG